MSKNKESSKSGISPTRKYSLHIRVSCIENMKNDITNVWGLWLDYYQSSYFTLEYVLLYLSLFPVHCLLEYIVIYRTIKNTAGFCSMPCLHLFSNCDCTSPALSLCNYSSKIVVNLHSHHHPCNKVHQLVSLVGKICIT